MRSSKSRSVVCRSGAIVSLAALAAGCQPQIGGGTICTMEFRYGISATVTDAATGANITPGSSLIVREGSYVDSVTAGPGSFLAAAGERAGTYDVTVRREGYSPFTRGGVVVTKDECHVHPVQIEARLQRAG
jgi:hypothetical protein